MAYFTVEGIGANSVTIYISPDSTNAYYRVFVRRSDSSDATYEEIYSLSEPVYITVNDLSPGTDYVVNVGSYDISTGSTAWFGAQTFTTSGSSSEDVGTVYVAGYGGSFGKATAYIADYNLNWRQCTVYVADYNLNWRQTGG